MALREHVERIGPDGVYHYQRPKITVAFVLPTAGTPPIHQVIAPRLQAAFVRQEDTVILASANPKEPFPKEAKIAIQFDDLTTERQTPWSLGRFPKTPTGERTSEKFVCVVPFGLNGNSPDQLTEQARLLMVTKASPIVIAIEGVSGAVATLEGNVGEGTIYNELGWMAERLAFLGAVEMVNTKEGVVNPRLIFADWLLKDEVQSIGAASKNLAAANLLWDIDIRQFGDIRQIAQILRHQRQAGYGEGMMSTLVRVNKDWAMAITETGTSKTKVDPEKGNVVAVSYLTEYGTVHWILSGRPKGHPINFLRKPSWQSCKDMVEFLVSGYLRGRLKRDLGGIKKGEVPVVDHPPSIESHENALLYHMSALLHAGVVTKFEDALSYLADAFNKSPRLPIIPHGLPKAADAVAHLHKCAKLEQQSKDIKVISADMSYFGFPHTPPCGSREAALLLLKGQYDLYQRYGLPQSKDEIWVVILPGHGSVAIGHNNMHHLTYRITHDTDYEPYVSKF